MSDLKISELPALSGSDLASSDQLAVVDSSASQTSKLSVNDLIANGVTLISDDTIPGAKILFAAGDIPGTALANSAVTTAKIADDAVTAAKLANNSSVTLVTSLPASGDFTGQLALDTDDNSLYAWDGSAWQNVAAQSSIAGSTAGEINIVVTTSGTTTTISATIDDTTAAAQFLAGPTGSAGTVGYRTIVSTDLPTATTNAKGAVIVNGDGLTLTGDTIGIDNTVSGSSTHHVVTYDVNGLITGGRAIAAADLPIATNSAVGGVIVSDGLAVDATGNLTIDNTVTAGTYTKVTVTNKGVVSTGDTLVAADIPDHSADKLTSGTIGTSLIANDAITADKIGDQATTKFGGAAGSDNVTIFPTGDYKGQFFYDETTQDLYIYTGSAFVPITVLSGNLVNAGAYNASTNQMSSVTSAGSSAGFSVGNALPAPAKTNLNHYVVVDTSGTGTGAAPAVALAPPDMLLSQGVGTEYSLIDVSNAIAGQTASNISLIATGDITATDVQAGITELDNEKLPKAGGTMTGNLELNNANVVFEGSSADDYETTLTVTNPTADRTITLPNVTGTVVTTGDTGSVTSTMITDGTIVNADINASAEIAVSKLANGTARQLLETAADGANVQFASNIDIPGTLDVTGAATFDSTVTAVGVISANGKISFPAGTAGAPSLYSGTDTDTGIYAPGADQFGVSTGGTSRLIIDSSGNVGIGTTSPSVPLHVEKNDSPAARIGGSSYYIDLGQYATGSSPAITYNGSGASLIFREGSTERMRIDGSGRLLIGHTGTSHTAPLQVTTATSGAFTAQFRARANNDYSFLAFTSNNGSEDLVQIGVLRTGASTGDLFFYTNGGSANGSERMRINSSGNVGIGSSSPNTKLVVNDGSNALNDSVGNINVISTDSAAVDKGGSIGLGGFYNGTTNSIPFANIHGKKENSTGNNAAGYFAIATRNASSGTAERMRISSSGNVGIGTTSPTSLGSSFKEVIVSGATEGAGLQLQDTDGNVKAGLFTSDVSGAAFVRTITNHPLVFRTNNIERMRISSSGNVGVGTTAPASKLEVKGGALTVSHASPGTGTGQISINTENNSQATFAYDDEGSVVFGTATNPATQAGFSEKMRIDSSGAVTVKRASTYTSGLQHGLAIQQGSATNGNRAGLVFKSLNGFDVAGINGVISTHAGQQNNNVGYLEFYTKSTGVSAPLERMRIAADGTLDQNSSSHGIAVSLTASAGFFKYAYRAHFNTSAGVYGGTICYNVWSNGNVQNTNNSYGAISDSKLKENIVDASSQWDDIKNLRVRNYNFIEGQTHTQIGVVAQEVETVSPGLVSEQPDMDENDNDLGTTTKSVNYSVLYMKAVKALQEAMGRIEQLEAKVAALEAG